MQKYQRMEAEGAFTACNSTMEGAICRSLSKCCFLCSPGTCCGIWVDPGKF